MNKDSKNKKSKIISIVNQKGGVGKTTTTVNLAAGMAIHMNKKVLVIDLDHQGNASTSFNIDNRELINNIYGVLSQKIGIEQSIHKTEIEGLSLIPSTIDIAAIDIEMANMNNRNYVLKLMLNRIKNEYDYIMIDCSPSLGILTINALVSADSLIIPMQCEFFALEGLSHLLKTIELVKSKLNTDLRIEGILLTMYDKRNKLCSLVEEDVRKHLGKTIFKTIIPRNVRISEAPSYGKPVITYDPKCIGSKSYIELAQEILEREKESLLDL
jgi:chromosome partitioning protein